MKTDDYLEIQNIITFFFSKDGETAAVIFCLAC